ncbi:MAG TPA: hypothetical protein DCL77_09000 [Prolixibacteraceae bacterium]|jgi:hypothetical protein|nr:hypothetical protein [Prolixibacteraceae bacterium]
MIAPLGNTLIEVLKDNVVVMQRLTANVSGQANFFLPAGNYTFRITNAPEITMESVQFSGPGGTTTSLRSAGASLPLPITVTSQTTQAAIITVRTTL